MIKSTDVFEKHNITEDILLQIIWTTNNGYV